MNEVTKIHLGRQSFTIAVDARKDLQVYIEAIKHQVGANAAEVIEEVELRMAELLTERGISADSVVLVKDIDLLKEQLGEPGDFKEEDGHDEQTDPTSSTGPKRLFRDSEHAVLAGVAAGVAAYLGVPALLIRILFVGLTFSGGVGILVYLLLWLLMPEAKSPADYLQMQGRAVTVDSIKEMMDRADVRGAAARASHIAGRAGDRFVKLVSIFLGSIFMIASLGLLAVAATSTSYLFIHGAQLAGTTIFPLGIKEHYLVICGLVTLVLLAILLAISGRAAFTRRWTFPTWAIAALLVCLVGSVSVGTALGIATQPAISQRYDQLHHTQFRSLSSFKTVQVPSNVPVDFRYDSNYSVEIRTVGNINTQEIHTTVTNDTLVIDTNNLRVDFPCPAFCLEHTHAEIIVHSPISFEGVNTSADGQTKFIEIPALPQLP